MEPIRIGKVARRTGLTVDAIRFYEKAGLLPHPARTHAGYRVYDEPQVADLEFIQKAQLLGFSLNEIRELFSIQRHPDEPCVHVRALIEQKLNLVHAKIAELKRLETQLASALRQCRKTPARQDSCPVLEKIRRRR